MSEVWLALGGRRGKNWRVSICCTCAALAVILDVFALRVKRYRTAGKRCRCMDLIHAGTLLIVAAGLLSTLSAKILASFETKVIDDVFKS